MKRIQGSAITTHSHSDLIFDIYDRNIHWRKDILHWMALEEMIFLYRSKKKICISHLVQKSTWIERHLNIKSGTLKVFEEIYQDIGIREGFLNGTLTTEAVKQELKNRTVRYQNSSPPPASASLKGSRISCWKVAPILPHPLDPTNCKSQPVPKFT